jgi:phosphotransferase system HPr (HPr) family protein
MTERMVTLLNEWGLHARPAFTLAKTAAKFKSSIRMEKGEISADIKVVTEILSLCAENGDTLVLKANGPDEMEAIDAIVTLISSRFGEEK